MMIISIKSDNQHQCTFCFKVIHRAEDYVQIDGNAMGFPISPHAQCARKVLDSLKEVVSQFGV